jgi:hypothetical protein
MVLPICDPANSHFKFNRAITSGVSKLDINIDDVMINGTNDEAVADPVKLKIVLITLIMYRTSPIFENDCPINKNQ